MCMSQLEGVNTAMLEGGQLVYIASYCSQLTIGHDHRQYNVTQYSVKVTTAEGHGYKKNINTDIFQLMTELHVGNVHAFQ